MYNFLVKKYKNFQRETSGAVTVEVVIIFPLIALLLISCFTFFDAFRKYRNAQNITFTVSDIISRYTEFNDVILNDLNNIYNEITLSNDANTHIRVTSVSEYFGSLKIDWSAATNNAVIHNDITDLPTEYIPTLSIGETVLLVETSVKWRPFSDWVGLASRDIQSMHIVSPRFAGKLDYTPPNGEL